MSVLHGHLFFSSPPQQSMTSDIEDFLFRFYPLHLFSYLNSWERASIFPFECSLLNKGTTGTIFITSLVWRRIEPRTSRTQSQHYTTRLSRRRFSLCIVKTLLCILSVFYLTALLFNIYQKELNSDQLTLLRIHVVLVL